MSDVYYEINYAISCALSRDLPDDVHVIPARPANGAIPAREESTRTRRPYQDEVDVFQIIPLGYVMR